MNIRELSTFSRKVENEKKQGFYATDEGCCKRISNLLSFQKGVETTCLDPTAGYGEALKVVTGSKDNSNIKLFGIELDPERAAAMKNDSAFTEAIEADFFNGVQITNSCFSFVFSNFPYMDSMEGNNERYEVLGVDKVGKYLKNEGLHVTVIPRVVLKSEKFLKTWLKTYTVDMLYKFPEYEYSKYKQYVLIGHKKRAKGYRPAELEEFTELVQGDIEELPENYTGEKIQVMPSEESFVKLFAPLKFNSEEGLKILRDKGGMSDAFNDALSPVLYSSRQYERPPIPLKKDSKFLCAVSGVGEGFNGSEATNDLHLFRGVAKVVEESKLEGNGERTTEVVTSYTKVTVTVIESDGKISTLE